MNTPDRDQYQDIFANPPPALRILLAEDNKVNQTVALALLRRLGLTGDVADNGRQALEKLAEAEFDFVFMDLQMPEMGGLEATREIRAGGAGDRNRDIPIIALTGLASRQDHEACLDAGMNGYLSKPISSAGILEATAAVLQPC